MESLEEFLEASFIRYAKINTRSDETSSAVPTTPGQVTLANVIVRDCQALGLHNVVYDDQDGYVVAKLPATTEEKVAPIGFIAHLDTADFESEQVHPQVHPHYDGKDIVLNSAQHVTLSVQEFPHLRHYRGQRLITTDGTTLLGVDDKAGIVEALGAARYLLAHPEIAHGDIYLAFGPDEEIGYGAKRFDITKFPVEFAYTLDNGVPGQLEYETFNAAQAKIDIEGTSVHPGDAYGTMVNAVLLAQQLLAALPAAEVPEKSRGYQGFFLVNHVKASIEHATLTIIIRDFTQAGFAAKKQLLQDQVAQLNQAYGSPRAQLVIRDQYLNIGDTIRQEPYIINLVKKVYRDLGFKLDVRPFRGGTDGNAITAKGIPTPNLFNGGENFHGQYEFVTTEAMAVTTHTIVALIEEHYRQRQHRDETPLPEPA